MRKHKLGLLAGAYRHRRCDLGLGGDQRRRPGREAQHGARGDRSGDCGRRHHTPIKHVVVIFQENVSFDHYFGTYPNAANTDGQKFHARPGTPAVDGLLPATSPSLPPSLRHSTNLLTTNPNQRSRSASTPAPPACPAAPAASSPAIRTTTTATSSRRSTAARWTTSCRASAPAAAPPLRHAVQRQPVMDYYDGNTVTGLWNYAQHFAMSDNSYGTTFGPSAPGAINLVSGDTGDVDTSHEVNSPSISTPSSPDGDITADGQGGYSLTSDAQPTGTTARPETRWP